MPSYSGPHLTTSMKVVYLKIELAVMSIFLKKILFFYLPQAQNDQSFQCQHPCVYTSVDGIKLVSRHIPIIINFHFLEEKRLKWVDQQQSSRAMLKIIRPSLAKLEVLEIRASSLTAWCNMPPTHTSHHISPQIFVIQTHMSTLNWAFLALIIHTYLEVLISCVMRGWVLPAF